MPLVTIHNHLAQLNKNGLAIGTHPTKQKEKSQLPSPAAFVAFSSAALAHFSSAVFAATALRICSTVTRSLSDSWRAFFCKRVFFFRVPQILGYLFLLSTQFRLFFFKARNRMQELLSQLRVHLNLHHCPGRLTGRRRSRRFGINGRPTGTLVL